MLSLIMMLINKICKECYKCMETLIFCEENTNLALEKIHDIDDYFAKNIVIYVTFLNQVLKVLITLKFGDFNTAGS